MTQIYKSLAEIVDHYDGYILDLWGVVHNGRELYPDVLHALETMKAMGKRLIFLSNAPREWDRVGAFLQGLGLGPSYYHRICTSGDVARDQLARRTDSLFHKLGHRFYYLGPKKDHGLLACLNYDEVGDVEQADFILNTGFADDESESTKDYHAILATGVLHKLPMICVNPDFEVMRGTKIIPCAGLLARDYEDQGGHVVWCGKPYPAAYEYVLNRFPGIEKSRICAIGDTLRTDIKGGQSVGVDSILVTGGILGMELDVPYGTLPNQGQLETIFQKEAITPQAVMARFCW